MDSFVGSLALVRSSPAPPVRWLLRCGGELEFIQAERLEGDSYRDAVMREVDWVLNLRPGKDCLVSSDARRHLSSPIFVPSEDQMVWFEVEFFVVDLFSETAKQAVENDSETLWLTGEEIHAGASAEGHPISERHRLLMEAAEVIPAW